MKSETFVGSGNLLGKALVAVGVAATVATAGHAGANGCKAGATTPVEPLFEVTQEKTFDPQKAGSWLPRRLLSRR